MSRTSSAMRAAKTRLSSTLSPRCRMPPACCAVGTAIGCWCCMRGVLPPWKSAPAARSCSCRAPPGLDPSHPLRALPVGVVVVPPLVGRGLGIALRRVLPLLLATERGDVEVAPGASHRLVAATVDQVRAEDLLAVAQEGVGAVPL